MTLVSALKKKIVDFQDQKNNKTAPGVKRIMQRVLIDSFSIDQKFKNLQDPLHFIHNYQIGLLVSQTEQISDKLKSQMQQISEFSKSIYKKIISREGNEYSFQKIDQKIKSLDDYYLNPFKIDYMEKKKNISRQRKGKDNQNQPQNQKKLYINFKDNLQRQFRHKLEDVQQITNQLSKLQINFDHIKLIDTPQFDIKCKHVQLYDWLKSNKAQNHRLYNQPLDIDTNNVIQKAINKITFQMIHENVQFGSLSEDLFFDFQNNLKFWKSNNKQNNNITLNNDIIEKQKRSQEQVLSFCSKFNKNKPSISNLCDFAMRKITCDMIASYYQIKRTHQAKIQMQKKNQNLDDKYNKLKKQFQYAKEMRLKAKTQRIPLKFVDTQSQTINRMKQKDFDNYFMQQIPVLLQKLGKLNRIRQKTMTNTNSQKKFVIIKNIYYQIKQILFKLLILLLKGEKFFPLNSQTTQQNKNIPYFTYTDLLDVQNRNQVQNKILELIYTKIRQFQIQEVDGVLKSQIIKIYVEERQKNNKILQIIDSQ